MIDLENKCVLVRTHEEYENVLKVAKKQGYRWYGVKEAYPYPFEEQRIPDILKFYSNKELTRNASLGNANEEKGLWVGEKKDVTDMAIASVFEWFLNQMDGKEEFIITYPNVPGMKLKMVREEMEK